MIRTKGRRRLACYHEAGHALARWWMGFHTDNVAVLTVEQVRAGVTGPFAEVRFRKCAALACFMFGGNQDMAQAREIAAAWFDEEVDRTGLSQISGVDGSLATPEVNKGQNSSDRTQIATYSGVCDRPGKRPLTG